MMNRNTRWTYRLVAVIEAADRDAVNAAMRTEYDPHSDTFTARLSADGSGAATHYWASMAVTRKQLVGLVRVARAFPATDCWLFVSHASGNRTRLLQLFDQSEFRRDDRQKRPSARVRTAVTDPSDILARRGLQPLTTD